MKSVDKVLIHAAPGFTQLVKKAEVIKHMQKAVQAALPITMQGRCCVANFRINELTVIADDSATATHLRFMQSEMLRQLHIQPSWRFIQYIKIKIRKKRDDIVTDAQPLPAPKVPDPLIPLTAREQFQLMAENESDETLKNALLSLATKKNTD